MVCLTCPEHRPDNVYSYDEPDELQGRYDPLTKSYSYIKPPKHLNYMDNAGVEQTSLFFTIPGEVRNKIYDLALPDEREYEVIFLGSKGDGTLTHWKYLDKPPNFKWHRGVLLRGLQNRVKEEQSAKIFVKTVWSDPAYAVRRRREMRAGFRLFHAPNSLLDPVKGPAALLRVSRQIHYEAAQIFYARVILSFGSHNLLCQFEARLTGVAKLSLTHLALFYEQYAHSKKMDSKVWRDKSDAAFEEKIQMIAREFPSKSLRSHHRFTRVCRSGRPKLHTCVQGRLTKPSCECVGLVHHPFTLMCSYGRPDLHGSLRSN